MPLFIALCVTVGLLVLVFKRRRPKKAENVSNNPMQPQLPPQPQGMYIDPALLADLGRAQIEALVAKQQARAARGGTQGAARGPEDDEPSHPELPH